HHTCGLQLTDGNFTKREDAHAENIRHKFPLLRYASTKWSVHVRLSKDSSGRLLIALKEFLTEGPQLLWIEALATFGQMPSALSRSMDDVLAWANTAAIENNDSQLF